jgi:hypothetical protein
MAMGDETVRQATLAALREEVETIHSENKLYWNRKEHSHEADMEHQLRQERLEQIREEMNKLQNG